jgi:hypothetical protein
MIEISGELSAINSWNFTSIGEHESLANQIACSPYIIR